MSTTNSGLGIVRTMASRNSFLIPKGVNEQPGRKAFRITAGEKAELESKFDASNKAVYAAQADQEQAVVSAQAAQYARAAYEHFYGELLERYGCNDDWVFIDEPKPDGDGFMVEAEGPLPFDPDNPSRTTIWSRSDRNAENAWEGRK